VRTGEAEEAGEIWVRWAQAEREPQRILQASDYLLANGKNEEALGILDRLLREQPRNWEALYREGVALVALDNPADATRRFQAILELRLADDELSQLQAAARRQRAGRPTGSATTPNDFPLKDRLDVADRIREVSGLVTRPRLATSVPAFWSPADF